MQSIVESAPVKRRGNPYRDIDGKFCRKAEAVYIVDSDGRLKLIEGRINTVHDKTNGQFAKSSGSSWKSEKVGTSTVWKSGDHKITNYSNSGMPNAEVEKVLIPRIDHLSKTNPIDGPLDLRIVKRLMSGSGKEVNGINELGTGRIKLSGGTAGYSAAEYQGSKTGRPGMAPAQFKDKKLAKSEATLVHEWGHAIDRRNPDNTGKYSVAVNSVKPLKSVSQYGDSSPFEAYAENFSEFYLSKGKTTEIAALESAKEFGWKSM